MRELNHYARRLASGHIGRRDFMRKAAALGASTALATSVAAKFAQAATPKRGGKLRLGIGHGATSDSLDPGTYLDTYMQTVGHAVRNNLTEVDNTGELVPELTEGWDISDDGLTYAFKLRSGVQFHNGKTMEADDVIASINHHRGKDSKSAVKGLLEPIVELKADGKNSVIFVLREANADWPFVLSDYHIGIMPSKDGSVDWQSGIGTGGYMLDGHEPGVRTGLKRNPNYFKKGSAHFDSAEILSIKDPAARTNALVTGEVDAIDRVEIKTASLLARKPGVRLEESGGTLQYTFAMRTDTPPFDDVNVRLAIKYAIDRKALLQKILRGHGYLGNDHPIGRSQRYFAKDLPQRAYDPDKAKSYLKKAGLSSLKVDLSAADSAFPGAVDAAVLFKESAAPAGIDINVVREPNDGYWSNVWMKKPFCAVYWSGRPTEDWMFSIEYADDAKWNDTFWKHDRFNELLKTARAELDQNKRRAIYVDMQGIIHNEGGAVIPMFANYIMALTDKVQHAGMGANWDLDGLRSVERWWFA